MTPDGATRAIYKKYQGNPWAIYQSEEHAQPFLCQVALFLTRCQGGDHSWLSDEDYQKLKKYLEHWLVEWDRDANGLCEWASAQHGMGDGQFDRAGVWRSFFCEGADLNSLLHLEFLAAEQIALAKGRVEDAAWFAEQAATKERLVQNLLWDEQDGFFYDRDNRTGGKIRVKAVHGLYPLWTGTATQQQADRIVKEHILNRAEFWSPFPLASYALNEPNYTQLHIPSLVIGDYCMLPQGHCNWRGGMWPHSNYMVAHGLARYGFKKEALELADRSFAVAASDRKIHEWYNAETGQPLGNHPLCAGPQVLMRMLRTELDTDFDPSAIGKTNSRVDSSRLRNALGLTEPFLETQTQNKP
jgi:glycogen debranching enzyme